MTTTPTSGAADLPEALRSIQRFEVVDCIDDKHVPAVIPKPHGPWVRYEDHIAALAAGQATTAQQPGAAYATLPDEREAFEAWYIAQARSKASTTNDWSDDEIRGAWLSRISDAYRSSFAGQSWEAWQARASYGQAPAQAAPAAVAGSSEFPHEKMDAVALGRYKVVSSDQSMFYRFAVVAGDGAQQLYIGREVDCQNMARKFAGAFLDGAFAYHSMTAAPTTQPGARQQSGVGISGFDHKYKAYTVQCAWDAWQEAAKFLKGETNEANTVSNSGPAGSGQVNTCGEPAGSKPSAANL